MTEQWTLSTFLEFQRWLRITHPELSVAPVIVNGALEGFTAGYVFVDGNPDEILPPGDFAGQLADMFEAIRFGWCENCYEQHACRAMHRSGQYFAGLCHTCFDTKG